MKNALIYIGLALAAVAAYVWLSIKPSAAVVETVKGSLGDLVDAAARATGLTPNRVKAIVAVESSGNPKAVGLLGERGLMQLMQSTFEDVNRNYNLGLSWDDMFDSQKNLTAGCHYLKWIHDNYFTDEDEMTEAYNVGPGSWILKVPGVNWLYLTKVKNYEAQL